MTWTEFIIMMLCFTGPFIIWFIYECLKPEVGSAKVLQNEVNGHYEVWKYCAVFGGFGESCDHQWCREKVFGDDKEGALYYAGLLNEKVKLKKISDKEVTYREIRK